MPRNTPSPIVTCLLRILVTKVTPPPEKPSGQTELPEKAPARQVFSMVVSAEDFRKKLTFANPDMPKPETDDMGLLLSATAEVCGLLETEHQPGIKKTEGAHFIIFDFGVRSARKMRNLLNDPDLLTDSQRKALEWLGLNFLDKEFDPMSLPHWVKHPRQTCAILAEKNHLHAIRDEAEPSKPVRYLLSLSAPHVSAQA